MPRVTYLTTNFTAGEISPRMLGRVDIARYQNGAEIIENAYPVVQGGCRRREGTVYVAPAKMSNRRARLIPFVFSTEQAYILEFGHQYMRVFRCDTGAPVMVGPSPYEISTPYSEDMLFEIEYAQGGDTMFLAHPSVPIQRLRRFDHDYWSLNAAPFDPPPFDEVGERPATTLTLSAATIGTGRTFTADSTVFMPSDVGREIWSEAGIAEITGYTSATVVTCEILVEFPSTTLASGSWTLSGSPMTGCTPSDYQPVGTEITLTLDTAGWRTTDVGKHVLINSGAVEITSLDPINPATVAKGIIRSVLIAASKAPGGAWTLNGPVWNATDGYPRAVALHEQRLFVAGSNAYPQTIWASKSGLPLDFTRGTLDNEAFQFEVSSNQFNQVLHLASVTQLLALSSGGEFSVYGGVEKPIAPTNLQVRNQSIYGCNTVKPQRIGNELYFMQRANRKLRAMAYKYENDAYGAPDLSVLAEHVTQTGIVEMAYRQEPDSTLWLTRQDGVAPTLTIDRDQDVIGWSRQITAGQFESVATAPDADGDQVWVIVRREINGATVRYVERFDQAVLLDCSLLGAAPSGSATWSSLEPLEGADVDCVADGIYMGRFQVTGGQITLPRPAYEVIIGLPYTTRIKLLTPEIQTQVGSAQGNAMSTSEVVIRLLETTGCKVNGQDVPFRRFGPQVLDQPPELFTGMKRIEKLGWARGSSDIELTQEQPLPFHVLSVTRTFTVNEG